MTEREEYINTSQHIYEMHNSNLIHFAFSLHKYALKRGYEKMYDFHNKSSPLHFHYRSFWILQSIKKLLVRFHCFYKAFIIDSVFTQYSYSYSVYSHL